MDNQIFQVLQAIEHCEEVIKECVCSEETKECAEQHRMLANWLKEFVLQSFVIDYLIQDSAMDIFQEARGEDVEIDAMYYTIESAIEQTAYEHATGIVNRFKRQWEELKNEPSE